jgi:hypothetical protein
MQASVRVCAASADIPRFAGLSSLSVFGRLRACPDIGDRSAQAPFSAPVHAPKAVPLNDETDRFCGSPDEGPGNKPVEAETIGQFLGARLAACIAARLERSPTDAGLQTGTG